MRWLTALALALLLSRPAAAQNAPGPAGAAEGPWRNQAYWIPMSDANGTPHLLYAQLCRPPGETPARLLVFAHGTPPQREALARVRPPACDGEAFRWFLERGFAVLASVRRGYGATGGSEADYSGTCENPDYIYSGLESARDVAATVDYAATLPFLRPTGMVMAGLSTGGWASIAYDTLAHPRVTALVNFSGGRGGHHNNMPHANCRPELLAQGAGVFGARATTPMLWVYTANDSFFSPEIASAMYTAFAGAGGRADFEQMPAFGNDGHDVFVMRGGSAIWGPLVERYLATRPAQ